MEGKTLVDGEVPAGSLGKQSKVDEDLTLTVRTPRPQSHKLPLGVCAYLYVHPMHSCALRVRDMIRSLRTTIERRYLAVSSLHLLLIR